MGLFGKKNPEDVLFKHLKEEKIEYTQEGKSYSFPLTMEGYSLYPYFQVGEENGILSLVINLRTIGPKEADVYEKMNAFNLKSPFFMAKLKENIVFLEARALVDTSTIDDVFDDLVSSLKTMQSEIDSL